MKEKLVIKLANEGNTTREIARIVHISLKDIGKIINRETGDTEVLSKEEK
jgi:DNA invertase Pin-like site-specific DNA recombinase